MVFVAAALEGRRKLREDAIRERGLLLVAARLSDEVDDDRQLLDRGLMGGMLLRVAWAAAVGWDTPCADWGRRGKEMVGSGTRPL